MHSKLNIMYKEIFSWHIHGAFVALQQTSMDTVLETSNLRRHSKG